MVACFAESDGEDRFLSLFAARLPSVIMRPYCLFGPVDGFSSSWGVLALSDTSLDDDVDDDRDVLFFSTTFLLPPLSALSLGFFGEGDSEDDEDRFFLFFSIPFLFFSMFLRPFGEGDSELEEDEERLVFLSSTPFLFRPLSPMSLGRFGEGDSELEEDDDDCLFLVFSCFFGGWFPFSCLSLSFLTDLTLGLLRSGDSLLLLLFLDRLSTVVFRLYGRSSGLLPRLSNRPFSSRSRDLLSGDL